jgi:putative ABC transport system permease protein
MRRLLPDLRFAVRTFARQPALATAAMVTLALGIGANSAIFSIVDSTLIAPPPFAEPGRVVAVWATSAAAAHQSKLAEDKFGVSFGDFYDLQRQARSFSHLAMFEPDSVNLSGAGAPEQLDVIRVTGDFAAVLGTPALLGRGLQPGDDVPGKPAAILLSHARWRRSFGADPKVVGRKVYLNGEPALVAGVMPPRFAFPRGSEMPAGYGFSVEPDAWVPYCLSGAERMDHGNRTGLVIGRLRPGVAAPAAERELSVILRQIAREHPPYEQGFSVRVQPIAEQLSARLRPALLVLWAAVGFVLLIACTNVASLLLARAASRQREIAVRTAIGAGRGDLVRQLLAESGLLALAGGAAGVGVAALGLRALTAFVPGELAGTLHGSLDTRVLAFTLLLCTVASILAGLLPAIEATRPDLAASLRDGARAATGARGSRRTREALVVAELALALLLLAGTGLLLRSFARLLSVDPGFRAEQVLAFDVNLAPDRVPMEARRRFYAQVVERLQALPGVAAAGAINEMPLNGGIWLSIWVAEGLPKPRAEDAPAVDGRAVTPGYFATMGIPLHRGRLLGAADVQQRLPVAVVDDAMARAFWPGEDPIGKRLRGYYAKGENDPNFPWMTVVGVVGSVHYDGLDVKPRLELYKPVAQGNRVWPGMSFVLRAAGDRAALAAAARSAVHQLDSSQPIANVRTFERVVADSVAPRRFALQLLGLFAALALALAAVGVYGVTYHSIVQRTRELGLRIALGALPRQVLLLLMAEAGARLILGLAIGCAAALAITRAMSSLLFGIGPADPAAYAGGALLLTLATLLAVWVPCRRATRLDPMAALRSD